VDVECLSYIREIVEKFGGIGHTNLNALVASRIYGDFDHLVHPCRVPEQLLRKFIPESVEVGEFLQSVNLKKKELAKRFDISRFPPDREPGFLGQAAMYEALRESDVDLWYYHTGPYERGDASWFDGFGLFDTLIGFNRLMDYYGLNEVDIVGQIFQSITPTEVILKHEKNWFYRVFTNIVAVAPKVYQNPNARLAARHLTRVHDSQGPTVARVSRWTGLNRREAKILCGVIGSSGIVHLQRLVSKNTGIVATMSKERALSKEICAEDALCAPVNGEADCFVRVSYEFRSNIDGEFLDIEAQAHNFDNYDANRGRWNVLMGEGESRSVKDIYGLLSCGDHLFPKKGGHATERDIFIIALLNSMYVEHKPNWPKEQLQWLVRGFGVPQDEAERGLRSINRKRMVRHLYSFVVSHDRHRLLILFNDAAEKTIPLLGKIIPLPPVVNLRANEVMTYGMLSAFYPPYLADTITESVAEAIAEEDVDAQVYEVKAWKQAQTANLLSLIDDSS
jgi:hypothetical protein